MIRPSGAADYTYKYLTLDVKGTEYLLNDRSQSDLGNFRSLNSVSGEFRQTLGCEKVRFQVIWGEVALGGRSPK